MQYICINLNWLFYVRPKDLQKEVLPTLAAIDSPLVPRRSPECSGRRWGGGQGVSHQLVNNLYIKIIDNNRDNYKRKITNSLCPLVHVLVRNRHDE